MACCLAPSSTVRETTESSPLITRMDADQKTARESATVLQPAPILAKNKKPVTTEGTRHGGQAEGTQRIRPNYHNVEQKWAFILSSSCHLESTGLRYRRMGERREDGSSLRLWLGPG